jgi:benzoyl-CoA reductase/2-hydroxyglutaryl-CoA dehydratase subunit BcrC/BadD/HgdB
VLHDNICPHVKRILDRLLAGEVPQVKGVVLVHSCETLRRLADAWRHVRPQDPVEVLDLPTGKGPGEVKRFADELSRLRGVLEEWSGQTMDDESVIRSAALYRDLDAGIRSVAAGSLAGDRKSLQKVMNRAVTEPPEETKEALKELTAEDPYESGVPVFVFGNVLADPEAFGLFQECGVRVVGDGLCTGFRQILPIRLTTGDPVVPEMASQILASPPCARMIDQNRPLDMARQLVADARASGARGVIAHVMKFCDPYLMRMPAVRGALREADIPLLVLEGDCTLRSLGQQRTRIEAFSEMLS